MASLFKNVANEEVNQFEEQLKDYVRYMAAVKVQLPYRRNSLITDIVVGHASLSPGGASAVPGRCPYR